MKFQQINKMLNPDLSVKVYGFEECEKGHSFGMKERGHYLFHIITHGCGVVQYKDYPISWVKMIFF